MRLGDALVSVPKEARRQCRIFHEGCRRLPEHVRVHPLVAVRLLEFIPPHAEVVRVALLAPGRREHEHRMPVRIVGALPERDQQVAELTPRAEAWDELASAEGDYSVADAAKILARAGVKTGPQRLFEQLAGIRWVHRAHDGKWRAYATAVDNGYLTEKPQSHHHPRTGDLVLDAPQVRVTVRGIERLRQRLGTIETGVAA
ncbi:hypothetical protein F6W70_13760 [Microbacterium maritypicum]|uniref:Antirepressor protein C-terminal domain-containing protein n=2 Tax=Microbacterium maritypicum TaxID=33918 RepID=A0AAD3X1D6_MICMQ|nr:hypothetical protein F6W70_13760 [Microbacterium liquefaciens]